MSCARKRTRPRVLIVSMRDREAENASFFQVFLYKNISQCYNMYINRYIFLRGDTMVVTKPVDIRREQKRFFTIAYRGEPVIVSRPRNENVVVISEDRYRELLTRDRLLAYYRGLTDDMDIPADNEPPSMDAVDYVSDISCPEHRDRIIGIAEGIKLCNPDFDFDECNDEIAELFGVG